MEVDIINPEDQSFIDRDVKVSKVYAGDLMLERKGKRRFEFQSGWEARDFQRGFIQTVVGYLKGQGGYDVVILKRSGGM